MPKITDAELKKYETVTTLGTDIYGGTLRDRYIYDLEHDCWHRVRRHQVKEQHTHFWDDQKRRWIDLKTLQP